MNKNIFYKRDSRRKRNYSEGELANVRHILVFSGKVCVCGMLFALGLIGIYHLLCG